MSHDSGVDSSEALLETGLMTPQSTPEPESMPELRSSGIEGTRLPIGPSTMEDDAIERTGTVREVHQTDKSGEGSPQDQSQDPPNAPATEAGGTPNERANSSSEKGETSTEGAQGSTEVDSKRAKPGPKPGKRQPKIVKTRDTAFGTRSHKRDDQNGDQNSDPGGASGSMVAAVSALLRSMGGSEQNDHLESLLGSLWPDQLEDRKKGFDHQTVHAVIAAAVQSKAPLERGAPGSVTTRKLHISDLPKPPKT